MPSFTWRRVDAGYELLTGDEWAPAPDDFQPPAGSDGPGPFHTTTLDTRASDGTPDDGREALAAMELAVLRRVIHGVSHGDCTAGDCIDGIYTDEDIAMAVIEAGWRPPPALDPANCGNGGPGHDFSVCIHCGIEEADYLQILDDVEREHDQP